MDSKIKSLDKDLVEFLDQVASAISKCEIILKSLYTDPDLLGDLVEGVDYFGDSDDDIPLDVANHTVPEKQLLDQLMEGNITLVKNRTDSLYFQLLRGRNLSITADKSLNETTFKVVVMLVISRALSMAQQSEPSNYGTISLHSEVALVARESGSKSRYVDLLVYDSTGKWVILELKYVNVSYLSRIGGKSVQEEAPRNFGIQRAQKISIRDVLLELINLDNKGLMAIKFRETAHGRTTTVTIKDKLIDAELQAKRYAISMNDRETTIKAFDTSTGSEIIIPNPVPKNQFDLSLLTKTAPLLGVGNILVNFVGHRKI